MNYSYLKLCLVLLLVLPADLTNYCKKSLCGSKKHIGCKNKGKFAARCASNARIVKITTNLRKTILNQHNAYRNKIAKGYGKFNQAKRMATMVWSKELAKLAVYNVKQCQMKHDACRNTNQFHYAGQNLAMSGWKGKTRTVSAVIKQHTNMWYVEYKVCPRSFITKYPVSTKGKKIGHFTAMMQEKSTHVGCAILRQKKSNGYTTQLMACNYAYTNIRGKPVYRAGRAASLCQKGVNKKFKNLCSINENYNVNTIS